MNSSSKKVVLYFYTQGATFIQKDIVLLSKLAKVEPHAFPYKEKWKTPFLFVSQLAFLLRHIQDWQHSIIVSQFAGYHSFLPCLLGKIVKIKTIIVAGGTDCVAFPSLKYGHFQNRLLALFTRWSYRLVHTVSAVHESLFWRQNNYYLPEEAIQGIRHFVPDAQFKENVIPNGYETTQFTILKDWAKRPPLSFISVSAGLDSPIRMKLKGIDMVLALANRLPNAKFTLVGGSPPPDFQIPPNVTCIPFVDNSQLPHLYNEHQFYIQLSISEGFPNALCEAMACGCIPVVSQVASMPEIVGNAGLVIEKRELDLLVDHVSTFIRQESLDRLSTQARSLIVERFPIETRAEGLRKLLNSHFP